MADGTVRPTLSTPALGALGCFLLLLAALQLIAGPRVRLGDWTVDATINTNYAEALAWRSGRLDIPRRLHDSALFNDRVYSVNPPLFSFLAYAAATLQEWQGWTSDSFYRPWYVILVALPLPLLGYLALLRATGDSRKAAFLTLAWIVGTPLIAQAIVARDGGINSINHLLSQTGLFLAILGCTGTRGVLPLSIAGLAIAVWSRPTMLPFALPILVHAWRSDPARRMARAVVAVAGIALILAAPMALNAAKFGSALETGYHYVYEGRQDDMAKRGRIGLFSTAFIPRNAYYMNLAFPGWTVDARGLRAVPDSYGGSIWLSMPILVYGVLGAGRWWRDRAARPWLISTLIVIGGLLCYHNTGYVQPGYYRYALDFLPVWLFFSAREMWGPSRTRWTLACVTWSCLYFSMMP